MKIDEQSFTCECCSFDFQTEQEIKSHQLVIKTCIHCEKCFLNKSDCFVHEDICKKSSGKKSRCNVCFYGYERQYFVNHQKSRHHQNALMRKISKNVFLAETSLKNNLKIYKITNEKEGITFEDFMNENYENVINLLKYELIQLNCLKFRMSLVGNYYKPNDFSEDVKYFNSNYSVLTKTSDIKDLIYDQYHSIINDSKEFQGSQSGWSLQDVLFLTIELFKFSPFKGGSFIPLPQKLRRKGILNIKNKDSFCFLYCIISKIYPVEGKRKRVFSRHYKKKIEIFNTQGFSFPMEFKNIKKFILANSHLELSINLYGYEDNEFYIISSCEEEKKNHVDLLFLESGNKFHYCVIEDFSKAFQSEVTKNHLKIFFCKTCLSYFSRLEDLSNHREIGCGKTQIKFNKKEIKFERFDAHYKVKFLAFADFECLIKKIDSCQPHPSMSYTLPYQYHQCFAAGYYWSSYIPDKNLEGIRLFEGEDAIFQFIDKLESDVLYLFKTYFLINHPITKISNEVKDYLLKKQNNKCKICGKELDKKMDLDHDHSIAQNQLSPDADPSEPFYGNVRGYTHPVCNRMCKEKYIFPIFFHNAMSYDIHILVLALSKLGRRIDIIPKTSEKYSSISWKIRIDRYINLTIRVVDSFQFLSSSLSSLMNSLHSFPYFEKFLKDSYSNYNFDSNIFKKQLMCYEKFSSYEALYETDFPPINEFFSSLTLELPSEEDYLYALNLYKALNMKNLLDYVMFYLKIDIICLIEVFMQFRNLVYHHYKIDPSHFFGLPGFTFNCALSYTNKTLELLPDVDYVNFVEKSIRGGICQGNYQFLESNSRLLKNGVDPLKGEERQIVFLDTVSLYSYVMSYFPLPEGGYRWGTKEELNELQFNITKMANDENYGYLVMSDIKCPPSIHDRIKSFPLLPEHKVMKNSKYSKLVSTLFDKKDYVCNAKLLSLACQLGFEITKVKKAIVFRHSYWLKPYIDLNTALRANSSLPKFYINIFKSLSNVLYGKFQQRKFNYRNFYLLTGENLKENSTIKKFHKKVSNPRLKNVVIFNENLVGIELGRKSIEFDAPSIISSTILDCSKYHMYYLYYFQLTPLIKDIELNYIDTDSLALLIRDEMMHIYKENSHLFDTSMFNANNKYGVKPQNAKVSGLLKDEFGERIISKFIYLSSKLYTVLVDGEDESKAIKKAKGITKSVIKRLTFKDYFKSLTEKQGQMIEQQRIISKKHEIFTVKQNRLGLKLYCDKRHFFDDYSSLPYGHYSILHIDPPFEI